MGCVQVCILVWLYTYLYPALDQIQRYYSSMCGTTAEDTAEAAQQEKLGAPVLTRVPICRGEGENLLPTKESVEQVERIMSNRSFV